MSLRPSWWRLGQASWLGLGVAFWLARVPRRLRRQSLTALLGAASPAQERFCRGQPLSLAQAVRLVRWICRWRLWRWQRGPQACLRQALALAYLLPRCGYPVVLHVGVYKVEEAVHAHSWITVDGQPVAEPVALEGLRTIYTCETAVSVADTALELVPRVQHKEKESA